MTLKRFIIDTALGIGIGAVLVVGLLRVLENRFIFFPPRYPAGFGPAGSYGFRYEEVWLATADGVRINAWHVAGAGSRKVLLIFHGNAVNLGQDGTGRLQLFSRLGVNLMEVDYRGYGESQGSPSETGVYSDAEAAYLYLVGVRRYQPADIFIYGQSLGSAVAVHLASQHQCAGLIVESALTSAREMARRMFRIPLLEYVPKSRFDSLSKISRVQVPVLIIHGTRDDVIPFSMGQRLYQAAREPKSFLAVEGAGHDDVFITGGKPYFDRLRTFLGGVGIRREKS